MECHEYVPWSLFSTHLNSSRVRFHPPSPQDVTEYSVCVAYSWSHTRWQSVPRPTDACEPHQLGSHLPWETGLISAVWQPLLAVGAPGWEGDNVSVTRLILRSRCTRGFTTYSSISEVSDPSVQCGYTSLGQTHTVSMATSQALVLPRPRTPTRRQCPLRTASDLKDRKQT